MLFDFAKQAEADKSIIRAFKPTKLDKPGEDIPVDNFDVVYTKAERNYLDDATIASEKGKTLLYDVEAYPNFFCICFKVFRENKYFKIELQDKAKLKWILENFTIVGFNSRTYDFIMANLALRDLSEADMSQYSFEIIRSGFSGWQSAKRYKLDLVQSDHVDLIEVAPLIGSLKLYAGRLGCKRMQDLPYEPTHHLSPSEANEVVDYCFNDLDNTELLLEELLPDLTLRDSMSREYGIDLRSRSDAQIAEHVIKHEIEKVTGQRVDVPDIPSGTCYRYQVPKWVKFQTPQLQEALELIKNTDLIVSETGGINLPEALSGLEIRIGEGVYRLGIGGLHSSEKSKVYKSDDKFVLIDRDVASYYPSIILNEHWYPEHLGLNFLRVYQSLVTRRLEAKKSAADIEEEMKAFHKNTAQWRHLDAKRKVFKGIADALKIAINGCFGKLGNMYSALYAPNLLLQVTITGQLGLLMLIEMLELWKHKVVSANTDGVISYVTIDELDGFNAIIEWWEKTTGFITEDTIYKSLYSRDVNNYIAFSTDNSKPKTKGAFSEFGSARTSALSRNPEALVCNDAVIAFLSTGKPISETLAECRDIKRFVTVRNVKGGAVKSGKYLGKTIRWYWAVGFEGQIEYKESGNKVPNSEHGKPLMELNRFPDDIDYTYYEEKALSILEDLGAIVPREKHNTRLVFN